MNVLDIQNKLTEGGIQKDVDSVWYVDSHTIREIKDISVFNNYNLAVIEGFTIDPKYKLLVDSRLDVGDVAHLSDFLLMTKDAFLSL